MPHIPYIECMSNAAQTEPGGGAPHGGATPGGGVPRVFGKELMTSRRGFGQLWQKTYRIGLAGADAAPREVIRVWKERFPTFWPPGNRFYASGPALSEGDIAAITLAGPAGVRISTGIMVVRSNDDLFMFMTPQGHILSGTITFTAFRDGADTAAQVQALVRTSDPLWEIGFRLGIAHDAEDEFWHQTLHNVARHFGAAGQGVTQETVLVDPKVQWSQIGNTVHNPILRSTLAAPVRAARRLLGR
jgi:hypothetical protein